MNKLFVKESGLIYVYTNVTTYKLYELIYVGCTVSYSESVLKFIKIINIHELT